MGLPLTVLYILYHFLSPTDIAPELGALHLEWVIGIPAALATVATFAVAPITSRISRQVLLLVAFLCWLAFVWIPNRWFFGPIFVFEDFTREIIVYFFAIAHLRTPGRLYVLRAVIVVATFYMLGMGYIQYGLAAATHTAMPYAMVGEDAMVGAPRLRGLGILGDPNTYGQYLLTLIPWLFVSNRPRGMSLVGYLFAIPTALILVVGIYFTESRGALVGLLILVGLELRKRYKATGTLLAVCGTLFTVLVYNAVHVRDISVSGGVDRLMLWSEGIGILRHSPIWGIGMHAFSDQVRMNAHNSFLLCACESGLVGFFLWVGLGVVTFRLLSTVINSPAPVIDLAAGQAPAPALAPRWAGAVRRSLIVYLVTSYFLSNTYHLLLYLLVGMAGAIYCMYTEGQDQQPAPRFEYWPRQTVFACIALLLSIWISVHLRLL